MRFEEAERLDDTLVQPRVVFLRFDSCIPETSRTSIQKVARLGKSCEL
jgi:hypothetical protein